MVFQAETDALPNSNYHRYRIETLNLNRCVDCVPSTSVLAYAHLEQGVPKPNPFDPPDFTPILDRAHLTPILERAASTTGKSGFNPRRTARFIQCMEALDIPSEWKVYNVIP